MFTNIIIQVIKVFDKCACKNSFARDISIQKL